MSHAARLIVATLIVAATLDSGSLARCVLVLGDGSAGLGAIVGATVGGNIIANVACSAIAYRSVAFAQSKVL